MEIDNRIVIGTSISPFDIDKQKECINSWLRSGFRVVSYNCEAEIILLKEKFSDMDVEFVKIQRSAVEFCGKELPFIQDILDGVSVISKVVCGYFNSDIYFDNLTEDIYKYIYDESKESLIVVHRNEIDSLNDIKMMDWNINFDGIDGFFVDKQKARGLYENWAFVQTVWDTFLLIMCKNKGVPVKTLLNPIAFHKRHKVRWNFERTQKTYDAVIKKYYDGKKEGRREIFYDKYNFLFEYSKSIVFCKSMEYKCLFVVEVLDKELEDSIKKQGLSNYKIVSTENEDIHEYDFIFKLKKEVVLIPSFCRFVFHLFETYKFRIIDVGRFFASEVEGRKIFNQLNKNIPQLTKINHECDLFCCVISNKSEYQNRGEVLYPVCYEWIDIFNQGIIDKIKLVGSTYMMPAGYRSSEWYAVNRFNLSHVDLVGCLDNDKIKVGTLMLDKSIYSAEQVLGQMENYNLILCTKYYQDELRRQIANTDTVHFIDADTILWVDEESRLYTFCLEKYKKLRQK